MLSNEAKISKIVSASCALICCLDKQYKITYLSPAWQHILNRPLEDYCHHLFTTLLVKGKHSKIQDLLASWTDNKECVKQFVCELNTTNGVRSYVFIGQSPLESDDYQLIFNAHDISELVQLKDENKKLRIALNTPNIGYWQIDLESNEVYWSD